MCVVREGVRWVERKRKRRGIGKLKGKVKRERLKCSASEIQNGSLNEKVIGNEKESDSEG